MDSNYVTWKIEAGTTRDLDELEKIYNDVNDYLQQGINYPGWLKGIYPVREDAEIGIMENTLFTLKVGGNIAGSIILNHKHEKAYDQVTWELEADDNQVLIVHTLLVHPDFMKQGISQKLMDFAKDYAIQKTVRSIRLDVAIQNTPAISLYEKCGYKYIGLVDLGLGFAQLS